MCEGEQRPKMLKVLKIVNNADNLKTFFFDYPLKAKPGQFIMLWQPGVGMKPFSISYQTKDSFGVTVFAIGEFTKKLMEVKKGELLGIQGPYGKGYTIDKDNVVLVGGGCGTASLSLLADELLVKDKKVHFIVGSRTKKNLLYWDKYKNTKINFIACTDDGTHGIKGFTTDVLKDLLKKEKISKIYTCGPEIMMKKVAEIANNFNVDCELSLERYMKCGFGICGQCVLDYTGQRVCKQGPVMNIKELKYIKEFAKYKRGPSGKKEIFAGCRI